jgi:hypothetical protein
VHAEHIPKPRHRGIPCRQHLRNPVAQHGRLAEEKIADVRRLQRKQVVRMLDDDVTVAPHGAGKIALEPAPRGRRVRTLAVVGAGALRLDGRDARLDQRQRAALGRHHAEAARNACPEAKVGSSSSNVSTAASGSTK